MKNIDLKSLRKMIEEYQAYNEQEVKDRELMMCYLNHYGSQALSRKCISGHFTTSVFLFNKEHTKVLMCYHLIDKSWTWLGGHADDIADLRAVALREVEEEAGITCKLINDGEIAALTCIPIGGHIKNNKYVSSHVHLDVAFVGEADETEELTIKPDENSGLRWILLEDLKNMVEDEWKLEFAYDKLIKQFK